MKNCLCMCIASSTVTVAYFKLCKAKKMENTTHYWISSPDWYNPEKFEILLTQSKYGLYL